MHRVKLPLILTLLLTSGCAALPPSRTHSTADEVTELKQRVMDLQRQAAKDSVEIARLRDQLAEAKSSPPPVGDHQQKASSQAAQPEISVEPPVTDSTASPEASASSASAREISSEDLPTEPAVKTSASGSTVAPKVGGASETAKIGSKPASAAPQRPLEPISASEAITPEVQALYDKGYTSFHQRHYADAESTFEDFLQRYPRSELADNASYWIGEARLQQQDVRGALNAFQTTVERYPKGNKVPDALLKVGECLESLGDSDSARLSYQEVVKRFPNSAASEVAKERESKLE